MQMQLPAHLANRAAGRGLTDRAAEGLGSSLPPHFSIQGNTFTPIDAAGNEGPSTSVVYGIVVDVSDHVNKRYYDKPWDPNASTYEPPVCWSANGIGPSREASKPQSVTCGQCPQNMRGSAVSKLSGAAIKACRDEKWLAVFVPQWNMTLQLIITPGSFKNWKSYTEVLRGYGLDLSLVVTAFSFEPKVNGVLSFTCADPQGNLMWVPEQVLPALDQIVEEKKTDALVGRTDAPRQGALPPPAQQGQLLPPAASGYTQPVLGATQPPGTQAFNQPAQQEVLPPQNQGNPAFGQPQQGNGAENGFGAPNAGMPAPTTPAAGFAGQAPVQQAPAPAQRRRRGAAAAAPTQQAPAFNAQPMPSAGPAAAVPANSPPFPVQNAQQGAPVQQQAPQGAQFGMSPGTAPNPELVAMLAQMGMKAVPNA